MKMTLEEHIAIARQTKRLHKELSTLFDLTTGKYPKSITKHLFSIQTAFINFKDIAEERMVKEHPNVLEIHTERFPRFTDIFYGGWKDIENENDGNRKSDRGNEN